jgi:hypothetical protein
MKYEIGDKIIVLHSDEEGVVVDLINDKMVMIEVRGVRFPAYMDQIDFPYYKLFTQKKIVPKKKIHIDQVQKEKALPKEKLGDGLWIRFFPVLDKDIFDDDVVEKFKIYLVNHDEVEYNFEYKVYFGGNEHFDLTSSIRPRTDFYLHDLAYEDCSDNPRFAFDFSLTVPDKRKASHYETALKLTGKQFFKKVEELQQKNLPSFEYELLKTYPEAVPEEKMDLSKLGNAGFRMYDASRIREHLPAARSVVDLHIDKITHHWKQLSNQEILTMQLSHFEKYYELAVQQHLREFIVIHGVGEGILRDEIHQRLRTKNEVKSFVNQYHHLYGYGATEIFFQ